MAWIGLLDARQAPAPPGEAGESWPDDEQALARGALLLEALAEGPPDLLRPPGRDGLVLRFDDGSLLLHPGREAAPIARLDLPPLRPGEAIRVTLAWTPARADLSAWLPDRGRLLTARVRGPLPVTRGDARRLGAGQAPWRSGRGVEFVALSDAWIPAGPLPMIDGKAVVATPQGPRPLSALRAGDLAFSSVGAPVRLLWAGALELPACGRLAPQRLRAPYFGLAADLELAADQPLVVEGSDVEYLFGVEKVAVAARHLAEPLPSGQTRTWHGVATLDGEPILIAGAEVATLDARPLLEDAALRAVSVLAGGISGRSLPPPGPEPIPHLTPLEATALRHAWAG